MHITWARFSSKKGDSGILLGLCPPPQLYNGGNSGGVHPSGFVLSLSTINSHAITLMVSLLLWEGLGFFGSGQTHLVGGVWLLSQYAISLFGLGFLCHIWEIEATHLIPFDRSSGSWQHDLWVARSSLVEVEIGMSYFYPIYPPFSLAISFLAFYIHRVLLSCEKEY